MDHANSRKFNHTNKNINIHNSDIYLVEPDRPNILGISKNHHEDKATA